MNPIKIVVAGDLFPSEDNYSLFIKGDSEALFGKEITQVFAQADFSIANLEGALTDSSIPQQKDGPGIKAPKETINGIKNLGLTAVALANNHITDYLQKGCEDTIEVLKRVGIEYIGLRKLNEATHKHFLTKVINSKRICIYNVSETFFNQPTLDGIGANLYDEWVVCNEIKELKRTHDFLIVIYHGGAEYLPYPTPQTRTRFHRMADCGADFITAQHTHCIGCEEWYKGSYLLHGQGNFLFARQKKYPDITKQGLVSEIILSDSGFEVNNHVVNIKGNILEYDSNQDLTAFRERSGRVGDEAFIVEEYQKLKVGEIMQKYLVASKGGFPFRRLIKRLFPSVIKHPEKTYAFGQVLRNYNVLQGERRREDMYYVWKFILDNYKPNKSIWYKL
jgi:poly-gamma-glutamate synthesis protein (capsule biosynthesis protein)